MKVEATWRGEGRLEILVSGVTASEGAELLDTIGAAAGDEPEALPGPVGWAIGYQGGQFSGPVWHRWNGRYMSQCGRWKADRVGPQFRPFLEDEQACRGCAA